MPKNPPDSACLSQADMERYTSGEMTGEERDRALRHLESCSACRLQVEVMAGDSQALFDRVREALPSQRAEDARQTLEAGQAGGGSPAGPAARNGASPTPTIEGYEIVRELHRGGQGIVYQAVQQSTKRKVAIKLLLDGAYASKSARKRFEREIELAANLKHPNIITIFHSGQTTGGHQYCVMDYIRGVSLDRHVRDHKLTLEDALNLFSKVCDAVNYAHQKGVIHRDLKPSNILVDADGTPKVLDFGLARQLINPEASLISVTGQVVGTLPYMSPEQARGNPDEIDTRTDIYALGVVLYEMLTGHYPYPVVGQMAEILKHISETEPTPPSRSWEIGSGISRRTSRKLRPGACPIDDEVQTIVLRTLSKERERRYQSAGELAKDIGHYLADEPIEAKQDSTWYVIRKLLRRYRVAVAVAAVFVSLLAGSTVALSIMYQNQSRARAAEEEQRKMAEQVTTFLEDMITFADPYETKRPNLTVREALDRATKGLGDGFKDEPLVEARLRTTIGNTYWGLGAYADAERHLRAALELRRRVLGAEHVETLTSMTNLGGTLRIQAKSAEAESLLRDAVNIQRRVLGDEHRTTQQATNHLGFVLSDLGKFKEAETLERQALETSRRVYGEESDEAMWSMHVLALVLECQGKNAEAQVVQRQTLDIRRHVHGEDHPDTLWSMSHLAQLIGEHGKFAEAETLLRKTVNVQHRVLGDKHRATLISMNRLGCVLAQQGKYAEAETLVRRTLEIQRRVYGDEYPDTLSTMHNLGGVLQSRGKLAEAEVLHRKTLAIRRRVLGDDNWKTLRSINDLGDVLNQLSRNNEAVALLEASEAPARKVWAGRNTRRLGNYLAILGAARAGLREFENAQSTILEAYDLLGSGFEDKHGRTEKAVNALVALYTAWNVAEPDKGYDAKAAQWRARLPAGSQPVSQPARAAPDERKDPS